MKRTFTMMMKLLVDFTTLPKGILRIIYDQTEFFRWVMRFHRPVMSELRCLDNLALRRTLYDSGFLHSNLCLDIQRRFYHDLAEYMPHRSATELLIITNTFSLHSCAILSEAVSSVIGITMKFRLRHLRSRGNVMIRRCFKGSWVKWLQRNLSSFYGCYKIDPPDHEDRRYAFFVKKWLNRILEGYEESLFEIDAWLQQH